MRRVGDWLTTPVPLGRVAAFRTVAYLLVAADIVFFTGWLRGRTAVSGELYAPLLVGRMLPLPTPNAALVTTLFWVLLAATLAAATGRAPRLLGWTVLALYFEWLVIAFSYGKVDHDRFGILVALAVLPTVGRARHGDLTLSAKAGWALRATQLAVIATYFLAAWAKLRFGGLDWLTGATLARAVIRRGTFASDWLLDVPVLLTIGQFGIMAFELTSPLVFVLRGRARYAMIGFFYVFHAVTWSAITISFMPHQAAMTAFLPLERVRPVVWARRRLTGLSRTPFGRAADPLGAPVSPADQVIPVSPAGPVIPVSPAGPVTSVGPPSGDPPPVGAVAGAAEPGPPLVDDTTGAGGAGGGGGADRAGGGN
ncbi:MFS transporter permease [Micromonospora sp. NBC_01796]|uniref:MFS transporter permease n=1 Tax=Micromonospora sp. NBC_01796 TaxID=2975987 RepID=UPI002DDC60C7|nr:MFS transporter permease [Micromonospora sp. NBC_01796]WSA82706.1 MFS transporter permease [Micromonospora sp. NBC_01796]